MRGAFLAALLAKPFTLAGFDDTPALAGHAPRGSEAPDRVLNGLAHSKGMCQRAAALRYWLPCWQFLRGLLTCYRSHRQMC